MKIRLYGINKNVRPTKTKIKPSMKIAALVQLGQTINENSCFSPARLKNR